MLKTGICFTSIKYSNKFKFPVNLVGILVKQINKQTNKH